MVMVVPKPMLRERRTTRRSTRRRGAAILETALALLVLFPVTFGTIEFAHFFYLKHTLQGAARQGTRLAIVPTSTATQVKASVDSVLANAGFKSGTYTCTVSPSDLLAADPGEPITVTIECEWGEVGLRPMKLIAADKKVSTSVTMPKDG